MAFKDNKHQRGQHNAGHNGHRQNRLKVEELEGHREKHIGHHEANKELHKLEKELNEKLKNK